MGYLQINLCDSWGPGERPDSVHVITSDGIPVFYVPERTCRSADGHCSKCGGWVNVCDYFCPRCGARVEGAAS